MTIKDKTITGLLWSFIGTFSNLGINFIIGIILARLLSPKEFGLLGLLTIFFALSQTLIDSGFGNALIRKKECTQTDYSTVFFFNLTVGIAIYLVLFMNAGYISIFFKEPVLKPIVRILGLTIIISSLTLIQGTILTKRIDFKLQSKISVVSSVLSGIIGIFMAYSGFGVWSLVFRNLSGALFSSLFLWIWNNWRPIMVFSKTSFNEMFGFGSKLLISALINSVYNNIYYLIIGKYFSVKELGFYTRAEMFKNLPSQNIIGIISRVTFPVLAEIQGDKAMLKAGYKRMITSMMLITFVLMLGMAAIAEPMVITLIGEKWRPSIFYLQMLCFVGMTYPLHALNLNMLQVQGRSDLFLKLEIIKKLLAIPTIVIGVLFGIKIMIAGMMVNSILAYYLNSYWSGKFINYPMREQIADIMPAFLLSLTIGILVFVAGYLLPFGYPLKLIIQTTIGGVLFFTLCESLKIDSYIYIKKLLIVKFTAFRNVRK